MATSLTWANSEDKRDIVHIVVQALVEGKLVILPTETTYHAVASALSQTAVEDLTGLLEAGRVSYPALLLRSAGECLDYSPKISKVAKRGVTRGWPGPLVLELPTPDAASPTEQSPASTKRDAATLPGGTDDSGQAASLASCLPAAAKELVWQEGFLAQRVVSHPTVMQAMRLTPGPLVAAPCVDSTGRPIAAPQEALNLIGNQTAILVDDGETHFGDFATRIRVDNNRCRLVVPGVIDEERRKRLFHFVILLVCTGNTCRSPMAEVMLRDMMQKAFPEHCRPGQDNLHIASAGLSAFPGGPASSEAQTAMKRRNLSLKNHQSRGLTEQSLRQADLILTMTRSHRSAILDQFPELAAKVQLLSDSREDVADPFGGTESIYDACANQIEGYLQNWVSKFDDHWFPIWESE